MNQCHPPSPRSASISARIRSTWSASISAGDCFALEGLAGATRAAAREHFALSDRHGGLFRRAPYWPTARSSRSRRAADPGAVREALSQGHKNDYRDAEAIAEAVQRPTMRFVAIKTPEQMDLLALHRVRSRLVRRRTGVINQIRGFLIERGIAVRQRPAPPVQGAV
jgi:hypothetical protein